MCCVHCVCLCVCESTACSWHGEQRKGESVSVTDVWCWWRTATESYCKRSMLFNADPLNTSEILFQLYSLWAKTSRVFVTHCVIASALFSSNTAIYWCRILRMINGILFTAQTSSQLAKCSSTFCFIPDRVVIHRLDKRWIMQIQWIYVIVSFHSLVVRKHKFAALAPPTHHFHLVSLTDAVPSLFGQVSITWNQ